MKKLALFVLLFTSFNAFAVETARCPQKLQVSIRDLEALSDDEILNVPGTSRTTPAEDGLNLSDLAPLSYILRSVKTQQYRNRVLVLKEKAPGVCRYYFQNDLLSPESRFYTRNGRDILRLAYNFTPTVTQKRGQYDVWVYQNIVSYDLNHIDASRSSPADVYGYFDHGSPRYQVGIAYGIDVSAK